MQCPVGHDQRWHVAITVSYQLPNRKGVFLSGGHALCTCFLLNSNLHMTSTHTASIYDIMIYAVPIHFANVMVGWAPLD